MRVNKTSQDLYARLLSQIHSAKNPSGGWKAPLLHDICATTRMLLVEGRFEMQLRVWRPGVLVELGEGFYCGYPLHWPGFDGLIEY